VDQPRSGGSQSRPAARRINALGSRLPALAPDESHFELHGFKLAEQQEQLQKADVWRRSRSPSRAAHCNDANLYSLVENFTMELNHLRNWIASGVSRKEYRPGSGRSASR
jgi:hypothetical protein